ncbi:MAG: winged helix DNA-binding protein [Microbacteriaceae bacterium]|nr:winged helix DNA-binding protein [Microbacteriaceae bacterium]
MDPAGVVRHFLGLQAQDFGQALWAVGVRAPGSAKSDVLAVMQSGEVVRSWPLRGTLMFIPAEDLGWMLALTGQRLVSSVAARRRQLEIDDAVLAKARDVAQRLLPGNPSTRDELFAALNADGITTTGQRGVHLIWMLSLSGVVCWGPPKGTQQGLVLVDEWVKKPRRLDRDESLRELALRYFTAHGPATV